MSRGVGSPQEEPRIVGERVAARRLRPDTPEWLTADRGRVRHAFAVTDPGIGGALIELGAGIDPRVTAVAVAYGAASVRIPRVTQTDAGGWIAELPPLVGDDVVVVVFVLVFDDPEAARRFVERWTATRAAKPTPWFPLPDLDVVLPGDFVGAEPVMAVDDEPAPHERARALPRPGGPRFKSDGPAAPPQRRKASRPATRQKGPKPSAGARKPGAGAVERTPTRAHIDAEMPPRLVALEPFVLTVRLSRTPLVATPGAEHADAIVPIDPDRPIEVTVVARGIRLAPRAHTTRRMRLPAPGAAAAVLTFDLIPIDVGRGEVSVLVRQEPVDLPLATMRLTAKILAPGRRATSRSRIVVATVRGRDADVAGLPSLRVDESIVDGAATLRIAATIGTQQAFHIASIGDKSAFIDKLYERLRAIKDHVEGAAPERRAKEAEERLAEEGRRLARRLLGPRVGALLWEHRSDLTTLIVQTSAEVDLPWEIVHLADPAGDANADADAGEHFLADFGLVRWVHDTARPRQIRVHADRVIGVAPDYRDAHLHLDRTTDEIAQLRSHLAADMISATNADDLSAAIKTDFDLLHFAGHGRWKDTAPQGQQLLLALFDDGTGRASYEDADARRDRPERVIRDPETPGPLVFLSACDVGRLQSGAAGIGGFAEAFLRGGAAAFIGCSWAVRDDVASTFVSAFYDGVFDDGQTVAEATLRARRAAREAGDLTALAFTVFAHPQARLVPA